MRVFALMIKNKRGDHLEIHENEEGAKQAAYEYVLDNWEKSTLRKI